ncbi:MAG: hypothetical protein P1V81_06380 [Planctomycetota bacterium]|nr:hypothetical protein [Planctomycetota bacterium]
MTSGVRLIASAASGPVDLVGAAARVDNQALFDRAPVLARHFDLDQLEARFGVRSRQWTRGVGLDESDLALGAVRSLLAKAARRPDELALLIAVTSTPSRATSSLAGRVARGLSLSCPSFDLRAGGAGALLAWRAAERWLAGTHGLAVVVAAESISPWLELDTAAPTPILFGDGAAAILLQGAAAQPGLLAFEGRTDAPAGQAFTVPAPLPPGPDSTPTDFCFQDADRTYAGAMGELRAALCSRLRAAHELAATERGLPASIDAFFPMAPSLASASAQADAFGVPAEHTHTCLLDWGCPGAAAPLIALAATDLTQPKTLALAAVGGGAHGAALTWRHSPPTQDCP